MPWKEFSKCHLECHFLGKEGVVPIVFKVFHRSSLVITMGVFVQPVLAMKRKSRCRQQKGEERPGSLLSSLDLISANTPGMLSEPG